METLFDYIQDINVWGVLLAAVAAFVSGAVWYSNGLFGKPWMKAVGLTKKKVRQANMSKIMSVSFVSTIVTASAMDILTNVLVLDEWFQGALFGTLIAVGFLGMNKLMMVNFEQRSKVYWKIVLGADILALGLMGAITAVIN